MEQELQKAFQHDSLADKFKHTQENTQQGTYMEATNAFANLCHMRDSLSEASFYFPKLYQTSYPLRDVNI